MRKGSRGFEWPKLGGKPVMLVIPPSAFLLDERVFVSLGILRVAAVLEAAGARVEVLDLSGVANFEDAARAAMAASAAEVVGVTVTTPQMPSASRVIAAMRKVKPGVRIVGGGPHPTLVSAACKGERKRGVIGRAHAALNRCRELFDVTVAGDGEMAIFEALKDDAPWLVDADDPKGPMFLTDEMYEEVPMPARHLVDLGSYSYDLEGSRTTNIIAQLGCPYGCNFCGGRTSNMLRRIRSRSSESIVRELEHLYRVHGYQGFMFMDDELNVNKGVVELMNEIDALQKRLGASFRLRGFVKSELFTDEQAEAMARAGFRRILCGFEAADPRILVNINKKATLEDNARVVEICRRHGLKIKALMSVGHAGETEESILAVRDWLIAQKVDDFDCTVISAYPGTPYYDEAVPHESEKDAWTFTAKKTGDRLHAWDVDYTRVADYYKGDPDGGYRSYVWTDHLSPEEIVALRDQVEREVRAELQIPFYAGAPGIRYEHSMGQGNVGELPRHILRASDG